MIFDEKDSNEMFKEHLPRESSVFYETTSGDTYDVYVSGDYAYLAVGSFGLAIINISDPTNPGAPIYKNTNGFAYEVYVSGDYAYVADGAFGLAVINISDPTNPGTLIYEDTDGYAFGVYVSGDYAYVADESGLAVIDISDPTNPGLPNYENTAGDAYGIYVSGDYAYMANWQAGLAVINISDPTNPSTLAYENTGGASQGVYVSGDYAYVADYSGLAVINISDPRNPGLPIYESTSGIARDIFVNGNYAYIADGNSGLAVINISDPTNPGTPMYETTDGQAEGIYVSGNYAYVADFFSLAVVEVAESIVPTKITSLNLGAPYDVYVSGDYAYIADNQNLTVVDISDPRNLTSSFTVALDTQTEGVFVSGDYAYVAENVFGLAVINISDPTNPVRLINTFTNHYARDVYVSGDYAYVADGDSGLTTIDISDPTNPSKSGNIDTNGHAMGVYVSGDFAYVADGDSGLAVINISDPTNPGTPAYEPLTTNFAAYDVYVSGDYAYVACGSAVQFFWGLAVFNISDPTDPGSPSYAYTTDDARGVFVSGDYAFVATDMSGLAVIDISDPTNPGTPFYVPGNFAWDVYVSGDYAYVADAGFAGLTVVQVRKRWDMVDPIITNTQGDFPIEYGYTGIDISWTATDPNPYNYTIELQGSGIVAGPSSWSSGVAIPYDIPDGLAIGDYIYTVNFTDDYDNYVTDTITITVQDTTDPTITNAPSNFAVEFGYAGVDISWTATDLNPNNYTIELQGSGIVAGPSAWSTGVAIMYDVPDGLAIGDYIYTVNFTDDYDNLITDSVTMTVGDTTDPIITNTPSDFTVEFGYTGLDISWTATDLNPNTYTIELQGSGIVAGPMAWSSGVAITYDVLDGLAIGDYLYTINFTDDYDNFITDTITMTVGAATQDGGDEAIPFGSYYLIFMIIGIIALVIVQKRKKLMK